MGLTSALAFDPKLTFGKVFTRGAKALTKKQENDEDDTEFDDLDQLDKDDD